MRHALAGIEVLKITALAAALANLGKVQPAV